MASIEQFVGQINSIVWGPIMLVIILGTGIYLTFGLRLISLRKIPTAFSMLRRGLQPTGSGEVSSFQALMTSLSATIGTGNIAGVATAIALGGPGALFWMWVTALVGMATKYAEAVCAVHYRERDAEGAWCGGPMYYIKNGLGKKWQWLATTFAVFGVTAGFGIGNTVQANSVADALQASFSVPEWLSGIVMMAMVALVIIGGVKRIASVAGLLVPFMAVSYLLLGLWALVVNAPQLPAALALIFDSAFNGHAAAGGFAGSTIWLAIRFGVARGVFSNEAGLGSAPIAHAAAKTSNPVQQGLIAMLGTFIDTLIMCSITGLVIIVSGIWQTGEQGAALSALAFQNSFAGGQYVVAVGLALFAFTTMLGWGYYCERCLVYLFGNNSLQLFRWAWILAIFLGAMAKLEFIWLLADTLNALMALPNLIALLLLSPVIFQLTRKRLPEINHSR